MLTNGEHNVELLGDAAAEMLERTSIALPTSDNEKYWQPHNIFRGEISVPTAFVFINTEPDAMPEVLKAVKSIKGVQTAEMVYGVYDIVAEVKTETMDQLKHTIAYKIRALEHVTSTQTLLVVG